MRLPKVIASSVVRSTRQGESHGGVYLVDLEAGEFNQVIDWNDPSITWEGRGSDRGLRGIAIYRDYVFLAASDELFVFDRNFNRVDAFRSQYLKHCHEVHLEETTLYVTSTGLNAVLEWDATTGKFTRGYQITKKEGVARSMAKLRGKTNYDLRTWDACGDAGPRFTESSSNLHINNVSYSDSTLMVSGTRVEALLQIEDGGISEFARLPCGTHNARAHRDGVVFNDTANNQIVLADRRLHPQLTFGVPQFDPAQLSHTDIPRDHARQGFARGLALCGRDLIIGGSSPSSISVYHEGEKRRLKTVNLSKDIRNSIHGLALWPF